MRFRLPTPVLVALVVAAVAVLCGLGVWQLQRNTWRNALIAERNAHLAGTPLSAAEAQRLPLGDLDYRVVALTGTWDVEHALVLANRARFGTKGEDIAVPLLLAPGGPAVLVDRGWYAEGQREAVLAEIARSRVADTQGLARYVEGLSGRRTPAGTWSQISPRDMGATLPYPVLPWYVIEGHLLTDSGNSRPAGVLLVQGFYAYESDVDSLQYAAQWFGLAAALVAIAYARLVAAPRKERRRAAREASPRE